MKPGAAALTRMPLGSNWQKQVLVKPVASNSSPVILGRRAAWVMPALLTSTSMRPGSAAQAVGATEIQMGGLKIDLDAGTLHNADPFWNFPGDELGVVVGTSAHGLEAQVVHFLPYLFARELFVKSARQSLDNFRRCSPWRDNTE